MPVDPSKPFILVSMLRNHDGGPSYRSANNELELLKVARFMITSRGAMPIVIFNRNGTVLFVKNNIEAWARANPK